LAVREAQLVGSEPSSSLAHTKSVTTAHVLVHVSIGGVFEAGAATFECAQDGACGTGPS